METGGPNMHRTRSLLLCTAALVGALFALVSPAWAQTGSTGTPLPQIVGATSQPDGVLRLNVRFQGLADTQTAPSASAAAPDLPATLAPRGTAASPIDAQSGRTYYTVILDNTIHYGSSPRVTATGYRAAVDALLDALITGQQHVRLVVINGQARNGEIGWSVDRAALDQFVATAIDLSGRQSPILEILSQEVDRLAQVDDAAHREVIVVTDGRAEDGFLGTDTNAVASLRDAVTSANRANVALSFGAVLIEAQNAATGDNSMSQYNAMSTIAIGTGGVYRDMRTDPASMESALRDLGDRVSSVWQYPIDCISQPPPGGVVPSEALVMVNLATDLAVSHRRGVQYLALACAAVPAQQQSPEPPASAENTGANPADGTAFPPPTCDERCDCSLGCDPPAEAVGCDCASVCACEGQALSPVVLGLGAATALALIVAIGVWLRDRKGAAVEQSSVPPAPPSPKHAAEREGVAANPARPAATAEERTSIVRNAAPPGPTTSSGTALSAVIRIREHASHPEGQAELVFATVSGATAETRPGLPSRDRAVHFRPDGAGGLIVSAVERSAAAAPGTVLVLTAALDSSGQIVGVRVDQASTSTVRIPGVGSVSEIPAGVTAFVDGQFAFEIRVSHPAPSTGLTRPVFHAVERSREWTLALQTSSPLAPPGKIPIRERHTVIGREPSSIDHATTAVVVNGGSETGVSRNHAVVWTSNGYAFVCRLNTTTDLLVNGQVLGVNEVRQLIRNDTIQILPDVVYRAQGVR